MARQIIVADSSPSVQKIFEMLFPEPDYNLKTCSNSEELLTILNDGRPEALILCLSLPHEDVYELVAKIKAKPEFQNLPIFLLKNAFEPVDEMRLASLSYTAIISKPFDSEKVANLIRQAIGVMEEPQSLPEELEMEDNPSWEYLYSPSLIASIRSILKQEIVSLERELEKRIIATLRNELRSWFEASLSQLKGKK